MFIVKKITAFTLLCSFAFFSFNLIEGKEEKGWFRFYIPWNYCEGSKVDMSFLLDCPAGRHGFLTVKDGHFYFEDGTRAKFWGVNLHSNRACFPSRRQAVDAAKRLAQLGCNIVRMHFLDNEAPAGIIDSSYNDSQHLSAGQMDRLDYFIYELKKNGIYVCFDVLGISARKFKPGDNVVEPEKLRQGAEGISFFNGRIKELSKKFALDFLSHVNPYTGNSYLNEPCVAFVEMTNENTMFLKHAYSRFPASYKQDIEKLWREWGIAKGKKELASDWQQEREFLYNLQDGYQREMYDYLRSIGVKAPIGASNLPYDNLCLLADSRMDFTDTHAYWDLSDKLDKIHNRPLIRQSHLNPMTLVNIMSMAKVKGRPLIVTEWGSNWPNDWRAEDILTTASYAALNDWDALFLYAYNGGWAMSWDDLENRLYYGTVVFNDPAKMGLFPLGALIFTGNSVMPSSNVRRVSYKLDELFNMKDPYSDRARLAGIAYVSRLEKVFNLDEEDRTAQSETENQAMVSSINRESGIASDTGQIFRDSEKGIFILKTSKVFSFSGFIGNVPEQEFNGIRFYSNSDFATFTIVSLDAKDISGSSHLLLTVVGKAENTGQKIAPHATKKIDDIKSDVYILNKGKGPILAEGIEGDIFIKRNAISEGIEIFCLDEKGLRKSSVKPSEGQDGFLFKISTAGDETIYYEIIRR